jgi:hypothetical protein
MSIQSRNSAITFSVQTVPTPGARAILNTFVRDKEEKGVAAGPAAKSAKDLLREHRQVLARAEKPVLGWGCSPGSGSGVVNLDISPAQARPCPPPNWAIWLFLVILGSPTKNYSMLHLDEYFILSLRKYSFMNNTKIKYFISCAPLTNTKTNL